MTEENQNKKTREKIIKTFMEIETPSDDDFLKIKETLTRIGISNYKKKTITQTAHILHKQGKYYIVHFLQLFSLDNADDQLLLKEDYWRLRLIVELLERWGMCKIKFVGIEIEDKPAEVHFTVLRYSEKKDWKFVSKYSIGGSKVS